MVPEQLLETFNSSLSSMGMVSRKCYAILDVSALLFFLFSFLLLLARKVLSEEVP